MGRIIAVYGVIAGVIVVLGMFISISVVSDHGTMGMVAGYLSMLVALLFVFVGVKRYRDVNLGGVIGFGKALLVGLGIAGVAILFDLRLAPAEVATRRVQVPPESLLARSIRRG